MVEEPDNLEGDLFVAELRKNAEDIYKLLPGYKTLHKPDQLILKLDDFFNGEEHKCEGHKGIQQILWESPQAIVNECERVLFRLTRKRNGLVPLWDLIDDWPRAVILDNNPVEKTPIFLDLKEIP
jgi:hypothetical protein